MKQSLSNNVKKITMTEKMSPDFEFQQAEAENFNLLEKFGA